MNGQAENRRGRKLVPQDVVTVEGFGQFEVVSS
ncbi:RNA-binding S4 domain-containing protein [Paenibacillus sp. TAF58]